MQLNHRVYDVLSGCTVNAITQKYLLHQDIDTNQSVPHDPTLYCGLKDCPGSNITWGNYNSPSGNRVSKQYIRWYN